MANRIIKQSEFAHYYGGESMPIDPTLNPISEPDKSKSISELSKKELWEMIGRLRDEMKPKTLSVLYEYHPEKKDNYDNPLKIDTKTPIDQLYHYGILGMKWGTRRFQNRDGSLTDSGKKRYGETPESATPEQSRRRAIAKTGGLRTFQKYGSFDDVLKLSDKGQNALANFEVDMRRRQIFNGLLPIPVASALTTKRLVTGRAYMEHLLVNKEISDMKYSEVKTTASAIQAYSRSMAKMSKKSGPRVRE